MERGRTKLINPIMWIIEFFIPIKLNKNEDGKE